MIAWLLTLLLVPMCTPNADGVIVCPSTRPAVESDAPAWIVEAMEQGTACELGVDIYSTAPGEAWYAWRDAHPDARVIERVQPESRAIPDAWLYAAGGQYVVFVFNEKLATRRSSVVHGACARLIDG